MYRFAQGMDWFERSDLKREVHKFLSPLSLNSILEIGSFEGLSAVFFADNYLGHPNSTLTCVDPFTSVADNDHNTFLDAQEYISLQEANFLYNISNCRAPGRIRFCRSTSDRFFDANTSQFTFIYMDGNHTPPQIVKDIHSCFQALSPGGILWMDDYLGSEGTLKSSFDAGLKNYVDQLTVLHSVYQLAIKKLS